MLRVTLDGSVIKYDDTVFSHWRHTVDHPHVFSPSSLLNTFLLDSDLERALRGFYFLARLKWKEKEFFVVCRAQGVSSAMYG